MAVTDSSVSFTLDGIKCSIHTFGSPFSCEQLPFIILPEAGDVTEMVKGLHTRLDSAVHSGSAQPHLLVVFEISDWEDALSPWPAPAIRRAQTDFTGGARPTLEWIIDRLIPAVEERYPQVCGSKRGLLGYSMAGLFALWAMYQTDAFAAYGSCSGSLWYHGFTDFLEKNSPRTGCSVYLSLGEKEEKVKNALFAQVGDATRRASELMTTSPQVADTVLVWHPGGHMGAVEDRLAASQLWIAQHLV